MTYRIYITKGGKYERFGGLLKRRRMLEIVKMLLSDESVDKILVIGHNNEMNYDEPVFLHTGHNVELIDTYEDLEKNTMVKKLKQK